MCELLDKHGNIVDIKVKKLTDKLVVLEFYDPQPNKRIEILAWRID